jgi:hypothetical protein
MLGRGGFGEVWQCEAPGGMLKAIKFVPGLGGDIPGEGNGGRRELAGVHRIKDIRHPFLITIERIEVVADELVIVMELADGSLEDRHLAHRRMGRPGVPRALLLRYLREAAEALDLMSREHGLQHLDLKPGNLLLVGNHVKVADFGMVRPLLPGTAPQSRMYGISPLYAAPEQFEGRINPTCDQYSLAVIYQELLTGKRTFDGRNLAQLIMRHACQPPDLSLLPEGDRPAVARALSKDPSQRFDSCGEFVRALRTRPVTVPASPAAKPANPGKALLAASPWKFREFDGAGYLLRPGALIRHSCRSRLSAGEILGRLRVFGKFWRSEVVELDGGALLRLPLPHGFSPGAAEDGARFGAMILLNPPGEELSGLTGVTVSIARLGTGGHDERGAIDEVGPVILGGIRAGLDPEPELRRAPRVPHPQPVWVRPILPGDVLGAAIPGQAFDVSLTGAGVKLPFLPPTSQAYLYVPIDDRPEPLVVRAEVRRARPDVPGGYEVGLFFPGAGRAAHS